MEDNNLYSIDRNRELIFLESIKELAIRMNIKNPYNTLRQSAILRFLLVDKGKFYVSINKKYNYKLTLSVRQDFLAGNSIDSSNNEINAFQICSYFKDDINGELIKISKFIESPIIRLNNTELSNFLDTNNIHKEYNVRQLIQLVANAHGGVHIENWDNIPNSLATDATSPFNINSNSKLHGIIRNISDITIHFLNPLAELVHQNVLKTKSIGAEVREVFHSLSQEEYEKIFNQKK